MTVRCPYCKAVVKIGERVKARHVKCPKCKKIMKIKIAETRDGDSKTIVASKDKILEGEIPPTLKIQLQEIDGDKRVFELKERKTVFGRTDGDFNIKDPNISKKHMVIEVWSADNIYVRDLSSTNGTFLNGIQIITSKLKDGDLLQIGSTKLKVIIRQV